MSTLIERLRVEIKKMDAEYSNISERMEDKDYDGDDWDWGEDSESLGFFMGYRDGLAEAIKMIKEDREIDKILLTECKEPNCNREVEEEGDTKCYYHN